MFSCTLSLATLTAEDPAIRGMWARQPFPVGNVPMSSSGFWHKPEGRSCWGPAFYLKLLGWGLQVPSEHVSTWAHQPCALAVPVRPGCPPARAVPGRS